MTDSHLQDLNDIFQTKARMGIMVLLLSHGDMSFTELKENLGLTDGNLGAHLSVLEETGYIKVVKGFVGRRPRTTYRITVEGREAFLNYLAKLESIIQTVKLADKNIMDQKNQTDKPEILR